MKTRSILLAALLMPFPALAQNLCGARAEVLRHLERNFGETVVAAGLAPDGRGVIERTATPSGSSWTLLVTLPSGVSCVLAAGESWQEFAPPPSREGASVGRGARRAGVVR